MSSASESGPPGEPGKARGELIIVTGSSHVGKSTLIDQLLSRCRRAAVEVSIDETIERLELDAEDRWEHGLHLAYERAAAEAVAQLGQGKVVFFESTFTYVPPDSRPSQFHQHELERLVDLALDRGARVSLIHLFASLDDVAKRRADSGRLSDEIVRMTWHEHDDRAFGRPDVLRLDTSQLSPAEAADRAWQELTDRGHLS